MSGPAADPTDEKLTTMGPDPGHPFVLQLEAMARVRAIAAAPGSPANLSPGEVYAQHKETLRREVRRQLLDLAQWPGATSSAASMDPGMPAGACPTRTSAAGMPWPC
jgi:hypothetical protein